MVIDDLLLLSLDARFLSPRQLIRTVLHPAAPTLLRFHREPTHLKYRLSCSSLAKLKPRPTGPSLVPIQAICDLEGRDP